MKSRIRILSLPIKISPYNFDSTKLGNITSARFWDGQFILDHYIYMVYIYLTRSETQEEMLVGKAAFELWVETFVVYIKRYHA